MVPKCQFYEKCVEAKRVNLWWPQQGAGGRGTEILAEFDLSRISFVVKLNLEEAPEDSRSEISPLCSRCSYKGELRISLPAPPSKGSTSEVDYLLPISFHSCHWIFPEMLVKTNLLGLLRQTSSRKFQAEMILFIYFLVNRSKFPQGHFTNSFSFAALRRNFLRVLLFLTHPSLGAIQMLVPSEWGKVIHTGVPPGFARSKSLILADSSLTV